MRLRIVSPMAVLLDREGIVGLRAEDESGAFGIQPGHAPFVTVLAPSVVSWRDASGQEGHCAVRGGTLAVRGGQEVSIAAREAVLGDDIAALEQRLRSALAEAAERERAERVADTQMEAAAIRRIIGLLRPGRPQAGGSRPGDRQ